MKPRAAGTPPSLIKKKSNQKRTKGRASAFAVAFVFKSKQTQIQKRLHQQRQTPDRPFPPENNPPPPPPPAPMGKMWGLRARPRRFAISFVVPDRTAVEISDKRRVRGSRPLRIIRIPHGGPVGFSGIMQAAEQDSHPMSHCLNNEDSKPDPKKAYHRSRINDWYSQLFYHPGLSEPSFSL